MRQRVGELVQAVGAAVFCVAGFTISPTVGLYGTAVAVVAAGFVLERS